MNIYSYVVSPDDDDEYTGESDISTCGVCFPDDYYDDPD